MIIGHGKHLKFGVFYLRTWCKNGRLGEPRKRGMNSGIRRILEHVANGR